MSVIGVGESASPDGYVITYVADEPRRVTGGVTTLFGTNEGSLVMEFYTRWLLFVCYNCCML